MLREEIIQALTGESYGDRVTLRCPVCDFDYTHAQEVYTRLGCDPHEAGVYPGTAARDDGGPAERRSAVVVVFECESGHRFRFVIQQHKGVTFLDLEDAGLADWLTPEAEGDTKTGERSKS